MFAPTSPADRGAGLEERIVLGRAAVVVETQDDTGQVRIVRFRTAELIVGAGRSAGAVDQILQLPATTVVADQHVQLAVRSETDHAAVVVAARRLRLVPLSRAASARRRSETRAA